MGGLLRRYLPYEGRHIGIISLTSPFTKGGNKKNNFVNIFITRGGNEKNNFVDIATHKGGMGGLLC